MSVSTWPMLGIQALLVFMASGIAVSVLKLLQRIDVYIPPTGASRVRLVRKRGDTFPSGLLPKEVQKEMLSRTVLFLFFSENCNVCVDLLPSLPALVRSYRQVRFVVCSRKGNMTFKIPNTIIITGRDLFRALGIGMVPYALKVEQERIIEFGLVNSCEHVESVLNGAWEEGDV